MYDAEIIRNVTCNPIAEESLQRVADAMNGLTGEFGKSWVEEQVYAFDPMKLSHELGITPDVLTTKAARFDDLVFLWDDLQILRACPGFGNLQGKLTKGRRNENVDLEISVAADLCRLTAEIELEPSVGGGANADIKFKLFPQSEWTYVEVTRKTGGTPAKLVAERGHKLASLVAARNPTMRHFIAVTQPMDKSFSDADFEELLEWIPDSAQFSVFKNHVFVGSVPHNTDETQFALPYFTGPVSCVTSGDSKTGLFGTAYLRVPDLGASSKVSEKARQTLAGHESLLFVDLSATHASQAEWDDQIKTMETAGAFSAVVLMRFELSTSGFTGVCDVVEPDASVVKLTNHTRSALARFSHLRLHRSL